MPSEASATTTASAFAVDTATLHDMVADVDHGSLLLHSLGGVKGLARKLKTNPEKGLTVPRSFSSIALSTGRDADDGKPQLTSAEAAKRTAVERQLHERVLAFGANILPEEAETSFWDFVKESLEDVMLQILIVSAILSLTLGLLVPSPETGMVDYAHGWVDGAAILLSVCLVTGVSSVNNYQKEQKFKQLSAQRPPKMVTVLRNGGAVEKILDAEVMVGDVLFVSGGDVLAVDGVVLQATQLKVDESAATGENDDVAKVAYDDVDSEMEEEKESADVAVDPDKDEEKREANATTSARHVSDGSNDQGRQAAHKRSRFQGDCLVRSGTNVVEGEGTILVTGVGVHSFSGRIAMEVRKETEETPLQAKLAVLATQIGHLGMAAAAFMFTILSAKEAFDTVIARKQPFSYKKYLDNLMTAVTIVVVAVPEGLPLSVTIALAYSMKQMFKENNLVRHLAACETMGGASSICTDKTGTITQNEMTVTDGVTGDGIHFVVPSGAVMAAAGGAAHCSSGQASGESRREGGSPTASPTTVAAGEHGGDGEARLFSSVFALPPSHSSSTGAGAGCATWRSLFMEAIAINTKCERQAVKSSGDPSVQNGKQTGTRVTGNKTEQALLGFVEKLGQDPFALRDDILSRIRDVEHIYPHTHHHEPSESNVSDETTATASPTSPSPISPSPTSPSPSSAPSAQQQQRSGSSAAAATVPHALTQKEMRVYPFTSTRKRMTTAFVLRDGNADEGTAPRPTSSNNDSTSGAKRAVLPTSSANATGRGGVVRYHVKGASEVLLGQCVSVMDSQGTISPLDKSTRKRLEEAILSMARRRLRTLALAYAEVDLADALQEQEQEEDGVQEGPDGKHADGASSTTVATKARRGSKTHGHFVLADPKGSGKAAAASRKRHHHHHRGDDENEKATACEAFHFPSDDTDLPSLTFLGLVGIRDPVRSEAPAAIARCRRAGVTVRMITGDNKATAIAIAREVGIYGPVWFSDRPHYRGGEPGSGVVAGEQGLALEGRQFREMAKSERTLNAILPKLQVISRASPLDKQILVAALMKRGEVVAVTGDGTNDAPALKNASVGFSMNSGTDVAKTASDVVIMDDNFATIVTAMKWGRNVNDNIAKFLQFQMTVNIAAVVVSFLGSLADAAGEVPLKPVQLLWINLIMDTLAALALATESPAEAILDRPPKAKNAPLISRRMWVNICGQATYQVVLQLWLLQRGHEFFGVPFHSEQHLSAVFNVFVLLQLFNEFNARILDSSVFVFRSIERAPMFLLVVGLCFVVQVVGVQYGGSIMRAAPLSREMWASCLRLSVVPLPLGALLRCLPVKERAVPPPPIVVDIAEEQALWERRQERRRPTLREVAKKVLQQLKIVRIFKETKKKDLLEA